MMFCRTCGQVLLRVVLVNVQHHHLVCFKRVSPCPKIISEESNRHKNVQLVTKCKTKHWLRGSISGLVGLSILNSLWTWELTWFIYFTALFTLTFNYNLISHCSCQGTRHSMGFGLNPALSLTGHVTSKHTFASMSSASFFFFGCAVCSMWDLGSQVRDRICACCIESLNH